jgi:hypothetical protein
VYFRTGLRARHQRSRPLAATRQPRHHDITVPIGMFGASATRISTANTLGDTLFRVQIRAAPINAAPSSHR